jgi:hypothetical protein
MAPSTSLVGIGDALSALGIGGLGVTTLSQLIENPAIEHLWTATDRNRSYDSDAAGQRGHFGLSATKHADADKPPRAGLVCL